MKRYLPNQRGSIAVYSAIALIPILLTLGLAVEFRQAENTKTNLQSALDSSVIAAVLANDGQDGLSEGRRAFDGNTLNLAAANPNVQLVRIDARTVEGTATAVSPPILSQLLGLNGLGVSVSSTATTTGQSALPCVILTGPSVSNGLIFNGGATLESDDCGIHGHSTTNPAAFFNAGVDIDVPEICLQGTTVLNNSGQIDNLRLGCTPATDIFAGMITPPLSTSCDLGLPSNVDGGSITLEPGVYCGGLNLNSNVDVTFEPGLYVIRNGNWNVNGGDWTGTGVTFYFDDTSIIQFNSGVMADLTPPTSGTYENILFFERDGLPPSALVVNDTRGFSLSGLVHLPSRNVTISGNGDVRQRDALLVFNSLVFDGAHWELSNELLADQFPGPELTATLIR